MANGVDWGKLNPFFFSTNDARRRRNSRVALALLFYVKQGEWGSCLFTHKGIRIFTWERTHEDGYFTGPNGYGFAMTTTPAPASGEGD